MGAQAGNNEVSEAARQLGDDNRLLLNAGQREVYGLVSPVPQTGEQPAVSTLQLDATSGNASMSRPSPVPLKDTFNPSVAKDKGYLPQVVVSQELAAELQAKLLREEAETRILEQEATDINLAILLADLERLNMGTTDLNRTFFEDMNGLRGQIWSPAA